MVEAEIFKETRKIKPTSTSRSIAQLLNLHLQKGRGDNAETQNGAWSHSDPFQPSGNLLGPAFSVAAVGTRGGEEQRIKLLKWCDKPFWQQLETVWQN